MDRAAAVTWEHFRRQRDFPWKVTQKATRKVHRDAVTIVMCPGSTPLVLFPLLIKQSTHSLAYSYSLSLDKFVWLWSVSDAEPMLSITVAMLYLPELENCHRQLSKENSFNFCFIFATHFHFFHFSLFSNCSPFFCSLGDLVPDLHGSGFQLLHLLLQVLWKPHLRGTAFLLGRTDLSWWRQDISSVGAFEFFSTFFCRVSMCFHFSHFLSTTTALCSAQWAVRSLYSLTSRYKSEQERERSWKKGRKNGRREKEFWEFWELWPSFQLKGSVNRTISSVDLVCPGMLFDILWNAIYIYYMHTYM